MKWIVVSSLILVCGCGDKNLQQEVNPNVEVEKKTEETKAPVVVEAKIIHFNF